MSMKVKSKSDTKKKLRILSKSTELILERGFSNTSLNLIQKEAKISKGLIYYHFENKDDLGVAVLEFLLNQEFEEFHRFQVSVVNLSREQVLEKLNTYLKELFGSTLQDRNMIQVIIDLLLNLKEKSSKKRVRDLYLRYVTEISNFLELIGVESPFVNAKLVLSVLDGLMYLNLALNQTLTEEESSIIIQAMKCMLKVEEDQ